MIYAQANLCLARFAGLLCYIRLLSPERAKATVEWAKAATLRRWTLMPPRWWRRIVAAGVALAVALVAYIALHWWFYVPPCTDQNFLSVVASMRDHPAQWGREDGSRTTLAHTSGLEVAMHSDYGHDWMNVGHVDDDHIPPGCRAAIRQVGGPLMDRILQRDADVAATEARQALGR